jgi:hypothetical protein
MPLALASPVTVAESKALSSQQDLPISGTAYRDRSRAAASSGHIEQFTE